MLHPKQYAEFIEEKIINTCDWNISDIPQVMINDNRSFSYDNFYNLFFPIFSETCLGDEMHYKSYKLYLVNHSKNKDNVFLPKSKGPKIIYFVNNSNAQIKFKNKKINLIDKKGKSIFINDTDEINLIRATNIQTCMIFLNLVKNNKSNEILYK